MAGVLTLFGTGGIVIVGGVVGAIVVGMVLLFVVGALAFMYAMPFWGFARTHRKLTKDARKAARSFREKLDLIDRNATAFRWAFTSFFPVRTEQQLPAEPRPRPAPAVRVPDVVSPAGLPEAKPAAVAAPAVDGGSAPSVDAPTATPPATVFTAEPMEGGRGPVTFWQRLTLAEQHALRAVATEHKFVTGFELCKEGAPADHVFLIVSGWTKVSVRTPHGERILARRGPGDLVGEGAAMPTGSRSATITAEEIVHAYVITPEDFKAFVNTQPRVARLLAGLLYDRQTEARDDLPAGGPAATTPAGAAPATAPATTAPAAAEPRAESPAAEHKELPERPWWIGQNCSIVFLDVTAFGASKRRDGDRQIIRRVMYRILRDALKKADVPEPDCHREDRGDGALVIVPPGTPTSKIVEALLTHLVAGLADHNAQANDATRFQLRVALHIGPVISDPDGVSGQAIIHAARIINAPVLKRRLAENRTADVGFIVSDFVYDNIIRHHPSHIDDYQRVSFNGKESRVTGWMRLFSRHAELFLPPPRRSVSSRRGPGAGRGLRGQSTPRGDDRLLAIADGPIDDPWPHQT